MERAVQIFAAVQLVVIGLSHAFQPRVWVDFFVMLRSKGHVGVFINGFISLSFGAIIVAFHNVWTGIPVVLTVIGWGQILKALLSFTVPSIGMRGMQRVSAERSHEFVVAGVVALAIGALLFYHILTH